jgi:uncharacterized membrane protein
MVSKIAMLGLLLVIAALVSSAYLLFNRNHTSNSRHPTVLSGTNKTSNTSNETSTLAQEQNGSSNASLVENTIPSHYNSSYNQTESTISSNYSEKKEVATAAGYGIFGKIESSISNTAHSYIIYFLIAAVIVMLALLIMVFRRNYSNRSR